MYVKLFQIWSNNMRNKNVATPTTFKSTESLWRALIKQFKTIALYIPNEALKCMLEHLTGH